MDIGKGDPRWFDLVGHMQPSIAGEERRPDKEIANSISFGIDKVILTSHSPGHWCHLQLRLFLIKVI
jgi:hypothetical protein